jgi:hypothetical protein
MPTRDEAKLAAAPAPEKTVEAPDSQVAAPTGDATAKTEKPAKVAKEPKVKAEPVACKCGVPDHDRKGAEATGDAVKFPGCRNGKSTRHFAPGHDAKLVGFLTRAYEAGRIGAEAAIEEVRAKSGNSALLVGKVKAAVKRVDDTRAATERREQAAKDAKAAEAKTPEAEADEAAKVAEPASV